jgi:hypothetical protein
MKPNVPNDEEFAKRMKEFREGEVKYEIEKLKKELEEIKNFFISLKNVPKKISVDEIYSIYHLYFHWPAFKFIEDAKKDNKLYQDFINYIEIYMEINKEFNQLELDKLNTIIDQLFKKNAKLIEYYTLYEKLKKSGYKKCIEDLKEINHICELNMTPAGSMEKKKLKFNSIKNYYLRYFKETEDKNKFISDVETIEALQELIIIINNKEISKEIIQLYIDKIKIYIINQKLQGILNEFIDFVKIHKFWCIKDEKKINESLDILSYVLEYYENYFEEEKNIVQLIKINLKLNL